MSTMGLYALPRLRAERGNLALLPPTRPQGQQPLGRPLQHLTGTPDIAVSLSGRATACKLPGRWIFSKLSFSLLDDQSGVNNIPWFPGLYRADEVTTAHPAQNAWEPDASHCVLQCCQKLVSYTCPARAPPQICSRTSL